MNKIRKYLIHLLGGVTEEYCDRRVDYFVRVERVNAIESVLLMMERCYGMPAEEWCKNVYEHTCELLRSRAEKLERVREQLKKY